MKNFKKVLFGGLAMLGMVTSASATVVVSQNNNYKFDNTISSEAELRACLETAYPDVRCTLVDDVSLDAGGINVIADGVVTLNLGSYKLSMKGNNIATSANSAIVINGGTIEAKGGKIDVKSDLTINNTTITSKSGSTSLIDITGATSGKSNITLTNVNAKNDDGDIINYKDNNAVVNLSGTYEASGKVIDVAAGTPEITLTGTYTSTDGSVYVEANTVQSKLTINKGTYTAENDTFTVGKSTVKVTDATVVSNSGSALLDGAQANTTINSGDFTGKTDTLKLVVANTEMTIKTATVKATDGSAVNQGNGTKLTIENGTYTGKENTIYAYQGALTIKNGSFTSEGDYALNVTNLTSSDITGGSFKAKGNVLQTSGNADLLSGGSYEGNNTGKRTTFMAVNPYTNKTEGYSAVQIGDVVYVGKTHTLKIRLEGEENMDVKFINNQATNMLEGHEYKFADDATKEFINLAAKEGYTLTYSLVYGKGNSKTGTVTADGFVMPDEDATLIVKAVEGSNTPVVTDPSTTNPEGDGQGTTGGKDETTDKNPGTFDGIANIVTVAISSLGAAGYSIKKIIKR